MLHIHFGVEDLGFSEGCSRQQMLDQHIKYIIADVAKFTFNLHQHKTHKTAPHPGQMPVTLCATYDTRIFQMDQC